MTFSARALLVTIATVALVLPQPSAAAAPIDNGGFETGDLSSWTTNSTGNGEWLVYKGTSSPISGFDVLPPPEGTFAAIADQLGPGTHLLFHDIIVPPSGDKTLSMVIHYENHASNFSTPGTLAYNGTPNQQFRIDLMAPDAAPDSLAPADVLAPLFATHTGDPSVLDYTRVCYDLANLSVPQAKLRAALVDNEFYFQASVDDVRIGDGCPPPPPPPPVPTADLAVTSLSAPSNLTEGDVAVVSAQVTNLGPSNSSPFDILLFLDGRAFAGDSFGGGLAVGGSVVVGGNVHVNGTGDHIVEARIFEPRNDSDPDPSNNVASATIHVTQHPEVSVSILRLDPVYIPTDAGPVRDPRGRFNATIGECNAGGASTNGSVRLSAQAGNNGSTSGIGGSAIGSVGVPSLGPNACAQQVVIFDTPGVIGDFTLFADLTVKLDGPSGDHAQRSSFHLVGDQGGVVLPSGATAPIVPPDPLSNVVRGVGTAQNTTTAAEAFVTTLVNAVPATLANEESQIANTSSSELAFVQNETSSQIATIENALAGAHPSAFLINETHSVACVQAVVCDATSGNVGTGNVHPCVRDEPFSDRGFPQWIVWYAVHVVDGRDVFVPQHGPQQVRPWPLADTPLPVPAGPTSICADRWQELAAIDQAIPV